MKNNSTGAVIGAERKGAVAWITLNRPQALNAIDDEMREQLPAALREADADADVRVIVIHGAGDRAFCAGADVKAFASARGPAEFRQSRVCGHWIDAFDDAKKPLIAAIHGYCLGGGLEMALACDIRIAAQDATFALPEVSRGTIPGAGGTQRLASVLRMGLITRLTARHELLEQTRQLAVRISAHAPIALQLAKQAMRNGTSPQFA